MGHPWIPASNERDRREMLARIGVSDPLELYSDVPRSLMLPEPPRVGPEEPLSEEEVRLHIDDLLSRNRVYRDPPPFTGGTVCPHYVPAVVDAIISRAEFYTAYTPYQPEINQGLLQALFEYQSLMADLLEVDVVNASMYDMSTGVAEAALMAMRVTRRKRILVPANMNPEHLEVLRTWLSGRDARIDVVRVDPETGLVDLEELSTMLSDDTASIYIEYTGFMGPIEHRLEEIASLAHSKGALLIVGVDVTSLGLLRGPGALGADIVVGEGQPLGLGLNYGGPYLGVFGVRWDRRLVRQMPGRLIGMTRTVDGERAFTMILQTREQHIRREKATSNITTNEALMAIAAAVYVSLLGKSGFQRLSREILVRSNYLALRLRDAGFEPLYPRARIYKNVAVKTPRLYREIHVELKKRGFMGGLDAARYSWPSGAFNADPGRVAVFCATEVHSKRHIDELVEALREVVGNAG